MSALRGEGLDLVTVVTTALPTSHKNVFSGFWVRDLRCRVTGLGVPEQRGYFGGFIHKRLEAEHAGVCWPVRPCESRLREWLLWWRRLAACRLVAHRFGSTS